MNNYQKATINDIYGDGNPEFINNADFFYKTHNVIKEGIELSDKVGTVNKMHAINSSYINYTSSSGNLRPHEYQSNFDFYPLMSTQETIYTNNNYKILSAKDIDFENAYLKYAKNQESEYKNPIEYDVLYLDDNRDPVSEKHTTDEFIFDREITPYINNTYDLVNIIDYLLNRMSCFYFLIDKIKDQRNILDTKQNL